MLLIDWKVAASKHLQQCGSFRKAALHAIREVSDREFGGFPLPFQHSACTTHMQKRYHAVWLHDAELGFIGVKTLLASLQCAYGELDGMGFPCIRVLRVRSQAETGLALVIRALLKEALGPRGLGAAPAQPGRGRPSSVQCSKSAQTSTRSAGRSISRRASRSKRALTEEKRYAWSKRQLRNHRFRKKSSPRPTES